MPAPLLACIVLFLSLRAILGLRFHVAPMQAYTNKHLRYLFRQLNPSAVLWTEMEKVQDLLQSNEAADRRLSHNDKNCVLQLGGNNPRKLEQCIKLALPYKYSEFNLNCGCPSVESKGAEYGASLMQDPALTSHLLNTMADSAGGTPISLKIRIGAYDTAEDVKEDYGAFADFVHHVTSDKSSMHICVHARAAVLSGLSITKNRCVPPLRYDFVEQLAKDFPHHAITMNGGIKSLESVAAYSHQANSMNSSGILDGFMIGRWALKRPLDLADIHNAMSVPLSESDKSTSTNVGNVGNVSFGDNSKSKSFVEVKVDAIRAYSKYAQSALRDGYAPADVMMPLYLLSAQLQEDYEEEDESGKYESGELDFLYQILCRGVSDITGDNAESYTNFRKLHTAIKSAGLGTKVFNKGKRNRNEM